MQFNTTNNIIYEVRIFDHWYYVVFNWNIIPFSFINNLQIWANSFISDYHLLNLFFHFLFLLYIGDITYLFSLHKHFIGTRGVINRGICPAADDRPGIGGVDYRVGFYLCYIISYYSERHYDRVKLNS